MSYKSRYVKITVPTVQIPKGQQAVGCIVLADFVTDGVRTLLMERPEAKPVAAKKTVAKRIVTRKATAKVTPTPATTGGQTSFNPETFPTEKVG